MFAQPSVLGHLTGSDSGLDTTGVACPTIDADAMPSVNEEAEPEVEGEGVVDGMDVVPDEEDEVLPEVLEEKTIESGPGCSNLRPPALAWGRAARSRLCRWVPAWSPCWVCQQKDWSSAELLGASAPSKGFTSPRFMHLGSSFTALLLIYK